MNKSEWNILEKIEPMLTGEELFEKMKVFPEYNESIRKESQAVRLLALDQIHSFYLPSAMSVEIYTKMYLAMIRAMKKKESKLAVQQRNLNRKNLRACVNGMEPSFGGIIGGSDSWSILGSSGVGKTTTIEKIIELFKGDHVIEMESPYCKIIPVISVQCPFDCGIKNLLFSILQKLDSAFGTSYYDNMVRAKANINTMLISTAQNLLNHVAVLCIDEVQNLIKHRAGMQLCSMLTELLNESSISIIFIGTPEIQPFFESVDYLARRTIGIKYERCYYDDYFRNFCRHLWKYQYVQKKTEISEVIIHWLYEHSAGTIAYVKFLYYTAQELSILNGREVVDLQALEEAYERMSMLHAHIQPEINLSKKSSEKRNISASRKCHQIRGLRICHKHKCYLQNSSVSLDSRVSVNLVSAEEVIPEDVEIKICENPIEIRLNEYMVNVFEKPIDRNNENSVAKFLHAKLVGTPYISSRGEHRYFTKLWTDMKAFYAGVPLMSDITSGHIQRTLAGTHIAFEEICMVAMFLGIPAEELARLETPLVSPEQEFDQKVMKLLDSGMSVTEVAKELGVAATIVRLARSISTKERVMQKRGYKSYNAIDWEKMDSETIRNKLCIGHKRNEIFLSNFISCALATIALTAVWLLTSALLFGMIGTLEMEVSKFIGCIFVAIGFAVSFAALYTVIGSLSSNKAMTIIYTFAVFIVFVMAASALYDRLCEPEMNEGMEIIGTQLVAMEPTPNPLYLSGTIRIVCEVALELLPTGQALLLSDVAIEYPVRAIVLSVVFTTVTLLLGSMLFRRKDIK